MLSRLWILVALCGCYAPTPQEGLPCTNDGQCPAGQECVPGIQQCFSPRSEDGEGGPTDAAPPVGPDGSLVSPDGCPEALAIVPSNFSRCDIPTSDTALVLDTGTWTIDTSAGTISEEAAGPLAAATEVYAQAAGPELMVVAAPNITIASDAVVTVTGARALVLVATEDLIIDGSLNASANLSTPGPGGNDAPSCVDQSGGPGFTMTFPTQGQGGSGGGGGAFGGAGGNGGIVHLSSGTGGPGGSAGGTAELIPLRGGCPGGNGGTRTGDPMPGGTGGGGGGALQLVAGGKVSIAGVVSAGGGGGLRGSVFGGTTPPVITSIGRAGGGGGSGGAVLLEAVVVEVTGAVTANGGGGGEGQYSGFLIDADGANAALDSATPALGGDAPNGTSTVWGGPGGNGATAGNAPTEGQQGRSYNVNNLGYGSGGGGGGGAVGRIRVNGTLLNTGLFSPAASTD